jgi:hypothetical protein
MRPMRRGCLELGGGAGRETRTTVLLGAVGRGPMIPAARRWVPMPGPRPAAPRGQALGRRGPPRPGVRPGARLGGLGPLLPRWAAASQADGDGAPPEASPLLVEPTTRPGAGGAPSSPAGRPGQTARLGAGLLTLGVKGRLRCGGPRFISPEPEDGSEDLWLTLPRRGRGCQVLRL